MFPLANMLHLFPHKFARLGRWRLSFPRIFPGSFNCFLFWHSKMGFAGSDWLGRNIVRDLD